MPRFTFTCEHFDYNEDSVESKSTSEFYAESIESVIENFEMFLRGAGFNFIDRIDIVSDDEYEDDEDVDTSVMAHIANDLIKNNKSREEDSYGDIFVSNENILIDHGAAQPVYTVTTEDDSQLSFPFDLPEYSREFSNDEYCSLCKLPISVMKLHQCFDPKCPSEAYRNQYAN